jgi:hypothetical protein
MIENDAKEDTRNKEKACVPPPKPDLRKRPWAKPKFESQPLKDALSGGGTSHVDGFTCS